VDRRGVLKYGSGGIIIVLGSVIMELGSWGENLV